MQLKSVVYSVKLVIHLLLLRPYSSIDKTSSEINVSLLFYSNISVFFIPSNVFMTDKQ